MFSEPVNVTKPGVLAVLRAYVLFLWGKGHRLQGRGYGTVFR